MSAAPLRVTGHAATVLIPQFQANLLVEVQRVVPTNLHRRVVDDSVEKYLRSIAHKLTIAMYQADLACNADAHHYMLFKLKSTVAPTASIILYKGCQYQINNSDEYDVFLTSFVETFSATAFSLLDVVGHLINDLYGINLPEKDASFYNVFEAMRKNTGQTYSIFPFISQYQVRIGGAPNPTCVPWLQALRQVRNRTTHQTITDICGYASQGGVYSTVTATTFVLNGSFSALLFPPVPAPVAQPAPGTQPAAIPLIVTLCDFMQDVFKGLEDFVDQLYTLLLQALARISNGGGLPLS